MLVHRFIPLIRLRLCVLDAFNLPIVTFSDPRLLLPGGPGTLVAYFAMVQDHLLFRGVVPKLTVNRKVMAALTSS